MTEAIRAFVLEDHFAWAGIRLVGKPPVGRTTIQVLDMNSKDQRDLRSAG